MLVDVVVIYITTNKQMDMMCNYDKWAFLFSHVVVICWQVTDGINIWILRYHPNKLYSIYELTYNKRYLYNKQC